MGCAGSRPKRCHRCRHGDYREIAPRSYSGHVHHTPRHAGDSFHTVALTSSTFESLSGNHKRFEGMVAKLMADDSNGGKKNAFICNGCYEVQNGNSNAAEEEEEEEESKWNRQDNPNGNLSDLQANLKEAKTWATMMNEKIPKTVPRTPIMTPPGEPETINTWELMEGLEDVSPIRSPTRLSFSFGAYRSLSHNNVLSDHTKLRFGENGAVNSMFLQTQETDQASNCKITDFDPMIIRSFRKSLQELPPDHPFHICVADLEKNKNLEFSDESDETQVEKVENFVGFDHKRSSSLSKHKVVLYFTSLRGIRKTYEDCCHARVILKSLGVRVDERDLSMDSGFKDEMKELLAYDEHNIGAGITLPSVFLGKKYLGGAEEIRKLNEDGKLEKLLECSEMVENGDEGYECEACGDIRFVPCNTCNGSCKVYYEFDEEDDNEGEEESWEKCDNGFRRCPDCNENGLIRCPVCCN